MPVVTQPSGMTSAKGGILTIGIRTQGDRCAIVLPMVADSAGADDNGLMEDLCESADGSLLALIVPCLSASAYISFVEAHGMMNGFVPHRIDYGPADNPGTGAAGAETSQVGALMVFYSDAEDINEGSGIKVGKNTLPGLDDAEVVSGVIAAGLTADLEALAAGLTEGITNTGSGGGKWYRVCSAPVVKTSPQDVIRVGKWVVRGYTGTQRRRLLPH